MAKQLSVEKGGDRRVGSSLPKSGHLFPDVAESGAPIGTGEGSAC